MPKTKPIVYLVYDGTGELMCIASNYLTAHLEAVKYNGHVVLWRTI